MWWTISISKAVAWKQQTGKLSNPFVLLPSSREGDEIVFEQKGGSILSWSWVIYEKFLFKRKVFFENRKRSAFCSQCSSRSLSSNLWWWSSSSRSEGGIAKQQWYGWRKRERNIFQSRGLTSAFGSPSALPPSRSPCTFWLCPSKHFLSRLMFWNGRAAMRMEKSKQTKECTQSCQSKSV